MIQPPGCQRERMPRFKQEGSAIRKGVGKHIQHEKRRSSSNEDQGQPPSPWKHRCHPAPGDSLVSRRGSSQKVCALLLFAPTNVPTDVCPYRYSPLPPYLCPYRCSYCTLAVFYEYTPRWKDD